MATVRIVTAIGFIYPARILLGQYDVQNPNQTTADCRGRLFSDHDGRYVFRAVVPPPYGIPSDVSVICNRVVLTAHVALSQGPVGDLLLHLGRHSMRAAHIHFIVEAPGFQKLITALYFEGDPYLESDSVFGVKTSLIVVRLTLPDLTSIPIFLIVSCRS